MHFFSSFSWNLIHHIPNRLSIIKCLFYFCSVNLNGCQRIIMDRFWGIWKRPKSFRKRTKAFSIRPRLFSQKGAIFVIILRAACRSCRIVEEDIRRGATEDGMKKTRTETVCKMKSDGIPFSTMAQYTELSIEEIEQL